MIITEVKLKIPRHNKREKFLCYASVTFDHQLIIHGIRLIKGNPDYFLAFPERDFNIKCSDCKNKIPVISNFCMHCGYTIPHADKIEEVVFRDIAHPLSHEFRKYCLETILSNYQSTVNTPKE